MSPVSRILVVDDEAGIRQVVRAVLEDEGYAVDSAANGREALEVLRRVDDLPDLILLDMRMPVMNGWEFAAAIREQGLDVPIIVMTAAASARRWAAEVQAVGHLSKPFDLDVLIGIVRRGEPS